MRVVIFAGGTVRPGNAINDALQHADQIIAADGGAETAIKQYSCRPSIVVGDLDSLDPALLADLRTHGCRIIQAQVEKDETDTELAIDTALQQGATEITLLGALGGARFDHSIANILLLSAYPQIDICIIDGPSICWLLHGPASVQISGQPGDLLSLFPLLGDVEDITTAGLYYPLHGGTLRQGRPRGISNVLLSNPAGIAFQTGTLLCIQTSQTESTAR